MKSLLLCVAVIVGLSFPELGHYSVYIRSLVMIMLTMGFLTVKFERDMFSREIIYVLAANLLIPLPIYFLARLVGEQEAEAAFLIASAPAAIASPIIIGFIRKRTDFVTLAVVATNLLTILTLPLAIPLVATSVEAGGEDSEYTIVISVLTTIIVPLLLALLLRGIGGVVYRVAVWTQRLALYVWLFAIAFACATAREFIIKNNIANEFLISIGLVTVGICIVNFGVGYLVGGKKFARESSQALGQKNTMFAVWVGLTFLNPLSVIAPVAYIIFQNIYNALQMFVYDLQQRKK